MKHFTRYKDSRISEKIKMIVNKVKAKAESNTGEGMAISGAIVGAAGIIAMIIIRVIVAKLLQRYQGKLVAEKIARGEISEEDFVNTFKENLEKEVEDAKKEIIRNVGAEARNPAVMETFIGDSLTMLRQCRGAKTVRELYNITGETQLRIIADAIDKYKAQNNVRDSAKLLGAVRLMNARLPGATFCSRRYGDGIDMRYFATDSLYGMKKSRLDRCYRDNVIAVAKEKTKAALSKAKRFAGEHPRIAKALSIMLAALATGSAVAIAKARKKVQPEFEYIGPKIDDPGTSKNIKEAFSWFKQAEKSFGDKYSKFSGKPRIEKGGPRPDDIVVDSLYGRKRLKKKIRF